MAIVGDILHSRVARSNINSLLAGGCEVHLAAPPTLLPSLFLETINSSQKKAPICSLAFKTGFREC